MTTNRILTPLAAAALLGACATQPEPAPVVFRGTDPAGVSQPAPATPPAAAIPAPAVDGAGVVDYGGYSAIVARPGDTVAAMAARVGLSEAALASYNGLPAGYAPRPGDELILPPRPDGGVRVAAATPEARAVETAPLPPAGADPAPAAPPAEDFDLETIEQSLAPPPPPQAATPAPDDATPVFQPAPETAAPPAPSPAPAESAEPDARTAAVTPAPVPAPAPAAAAFASPVDGSIVRGFNSGASGPRSDGVTFAAPAGAPVVAAAAGQVALISESLGGLGTIVLVRHPDDLLTVYGRVTDVSVGKGDRVARGQPIGAVAPAPDGGDPTLHFEVRRGARSVDPAGFLPG